MEIGRLNAKLNLDSSDFNSGIRSANKSLKDIGKGFSGLQTMVISMNQGLQLIRDSFRSISGASKTLLDAGMRAQRLSNAFKSITGDSKSASKELDFLRKTSDRLGLSFYGVADSYKGIAAAARGTTLEGEETRKIFYSVSEASTALGLTADQTSGALYALSQMISKGTVSSEELRQQLGERIPGAMQIAARSMNMTVQQFTKQLESGAIQAVDFLPRFAQQLHKEMEQGAKLGARSVQAQLNRLENAWNDTKEQFANTAFLDAVSEGFEELATQMKDPELQAQVKKLGEHLGDIVKTVSREGLPAIKKMQPVLSSIWNVLESLWDGFNDMPTWMKEVGILGAIVGGKKGKALLAGAALMMDTIQTSAEGFAAWSDGKISFGDLATSNKQELKDLLNKGATPEKLPNLNKPEVVTGGEPDRKPLLNFGSNSSFTPTGSTGKTDPQKFQQDIIQATTEIESAMRRVWVGEHQAALMDVDQKYKNMTATAQQRFNGQVPQSIQLEIDKWRKLSRELVNAQEKYKTTTKEVEKAADTFDSIYTSIESMGEELETIERMKGLEGTARELETIKIQYEKMLGKNPEFTDLIGLWKEKAEALVQAKKASEDYTGTMLDGFKSLTDASGATSKKMDEVWMQTSSSMAYSMNSFFFDSVTGQMEELGDYVNSFMNSMSQAVSSFLSEQLVSGIGSLFGFGGSGGGGGSWFSGIPFVGDILGMFFHKGGVVGGPAPMRPLPANTWNNAPRFHNGLLPNEYPAILEKGEVVIPKDGWKTNKASSQPVRVEVINNTGTQAQVNQQESHFDIQRNVITLVMDAVTRNVEGSRNFFGR